MIGTKLIITLGLSVLLILSCGNPAEPSAWPDGAYLYLSSAWPDLGHTILDVFAGLGCRRGNSRQRVDEAQIFGRHV